MNTSEHSNILIASIVILVFGHGPNGKGKASNWLVVQHHWFAGSWKVSLESLRVFIEVGQFLAETSH